MWKLLKQEILYNTAIPTIIVIVFIQLVLYTLLKVYDHINGLITILVLVIFLSKIFERNKEKIIRQNILLPISIKKIALSRSLLILFPWILLILLLLIINRLILPESFENILTLVGQFGFLIIILSASVLLRDIYLQFANTKKGKPIVITTISFIGLLTFTILIIILADMIDPKLSEGKGIILIYVWGIFLTFLSVYSFIKRKSYLI